MTGQRSGSTCLRYALIAIGALCWLSGCNTPTRALRNVGCGEAALPLLTDFLMHPWGIGSFACVRLRSTNATEHRRIEAACTLARAELQRAEFSMRDIPVLPPPFWDLGEGEAVKRAKVRGPGEHWEGAIFWKQSVEGEIWLMCAAGL